MKLRILKPQRWSVCHTIDGIDVVRPDRSQVCRCFKVEDAELIAAAPELYDLLFAAIQQICWDQRCLNRPAKSFRRRRPNPGYHLKFVQALYRAHGLAYKKEPKYSKDAREKRGRKEAKKLRAWAERNWPGMFNRSEK